MEVLTFPVQRILQPSFSVFPPADEDDKYIVLPYFWVPEDTLDLRVRRDHVPYTYGKEKAIFKQQKGMLFITDILKVSLKA